MSSLNGKVAVVTGASKGIGSGIADALAAAETRVAANYSSDRKRADRLTQVIVKSGGKAITFGADVSKAADVVRLFDEVGTVFGRLDVLVNNAGISRFGTLAEISEESFHLHYNINVLGLIFTVQQAIERFGAEGGSIINLSSIVGSRPMPGALLYASTHPSHRIQNDWSHAVLKERLDESGMCGSKNPRMSSQAASIGREAFRLRDSENLGLVLIDLKRHAPKSRRSTLAPSKFR
jgi:NAD(P)-dependent dehydrogenase (short-subunit alcohol dehydrogenase family)